LVLIAAMTAFSLDILHASPGSLVGVPISVVVSGWRSSTKRRWKQILGLVPPDEDPGLS
jgi:hypothetical protein